MPKPTPETTPDKPSVPAPTSLLSEIDTLRELKPEDLRPYFIRAMDVLAEMAENTSFDTHARLDAVKGIDVLYSTIAAKEFAEGAVTRATRSNDKLTDEVRRARRKDSDTWGDDGKGER